MLALVAGVPLWVGNGPSGVMHYLRYPQGNNLEQIKDDPAQHHEDLNFACCFLAKNES